MAPALPHDQSQAPDKHAAAQEAKRGVGQVLAALFPAKNVRPPPRPSLTSSAPWDSAEVVQGRTLTSVPWCQECVKVVTASIQMDLFAVPAPKGFFLTAREESVLIGMSATRAADCVEMVHVQTPMVDSSALALLAMLRDPLAPARMSMSAVKLATSVPLGATTHLGHIDVSVLMATSWPLMAVTVEMLMSAEPKQTTASSAAKISLEPLPVFVPLDTASLDSRMIAKTSTSAERGQTCVKMDAA